MKIKADLKKPMTAIVFNSTVLSLVGFLYFCVSFISVLSREKKIKIIKLIILGSEKNENQTDFPFF